MNPQEALLARQLELLHKAAFGCMDARQQLTGFDDPRAAHKLVSACIEVLSGVRESLEMENGIARTDYFAVDAPHPDVCPMCGGGGCPICHEQRYQ